MTRGLCEGAKGSQSVLHHHQEAAHDADDGENRSWEASQNDDKKMKKNCRQKRQLLLHRI